MPIGNELVLLGYDFPRRRVPAGGQLPITLYWQAQSYVQNSYIIFNHLLALDDLHQWGGQDRVPQNYYSTALWAPGEVVVDSYTIPVNPQAPNGIYRLDVGVYLDVNGAAYSLPLVADGQALDRSSVTVATVKVGGPPSTAVVGAAVPQHQRKDDLSSQIILVGYDLLQEPSSLSVTLYWRCETGLPVDYTTFVHLRPVDDPDAAPVAQMDRPPVNGAYPTSLWDPGEIIRDQIVVPLPAGLDKGKYALVVGLYDPSTGQRLEVSSSEAQVAQAAKSEILLQQISIRP